MGRAYNWPAAFQKQNFITLTCFMKTIFQLFSFVFLWSSCTHPPTNYAGQYPDEVRSIIDNKCATAGCHNDKSFQNAANLRLDKWEHLWQGSGTGSVVIPYNSSNSSLTYFINNNPDLGPVLQPQMPINGTALSAAEYAIIKNWIDAGAPDKVGNIPFATNPENRQKIYISQQGCDLIAVIDAQTNLIMRYIKIGKEPGIEVAHALRFSPDGRYCYVVFTNGKYLQKIDASSDAVVGDLFLGNGSWNLLHISDDGKSALVTDYSPFNAKVKLLNLETMSITATYEDFVNPHGIASNAAFDTFLISSQRGNTVYRLTKKGNVRLFSIDGEEPNFNNQTIDPHEIIMSPDRTKYFLTCEASNEVRVMDVKTNTLLKVIPLGTKPQEFAMSHVLPYLFVSCEEEQTLEFPNFKGAIYVINYNTLELVKRIPGPFYQIHGIAVDDKSGRLFIASRNIATTGPAPHHTSECGGRNGFYTVYDIHTLQPFTNKRFECSVDPYSADVRFK
jgi:DNA-binding beta-propeller fold protein YncE